MLTAYPRKRGATATGICSIIGRVPGSNTPNIGYGLGYGLGYGGKPFDPINLVGTDAGEIDILYDFTALGLQDGADILTVVNSGGFGASHDLGSANGFVKYNAVDPCVTTIGVTGSPILSTPGTIPLLGHRAYILVRTTHNAGRTVLGKSPYGSPKVTVSGDQTTRFISGAGSAYGPTINRNTWSLVEIDVTATIAQLTVNGVVGTPVNGVFSDRDAGMDRFFNSGNNGDFWNNGSIAYFALVRHGGDPSVYSNMRQFVAALKGVSLP